MGAGQRAMAGRAGGRAALATLAVLLTLGFSAAPAGAAPARPFLVPDAPFAGRPRLALLPLEDFSGKAETSEIVTRILFSELVRTGACEVVELGQAEGAVDDLRLRDTGALTAEQARQLGEKLDAPYLMIGSILEYGSVRTPDGDVPAAALTLRVLEGKTGRVVWAEMMARTGEDKETLFGWGREYDAGKMTQQMAAAMLASLHELTVPAPERSRHGKAAGKGNDRSGRKSSGKKTVEKPAGAEAAPGDTTLAQPAGGNR